jgi:hypothetical protein
MKKMIKKTTDGVLKALATFIVVMLLVIIGSLALWVCSGNANAQGVSLGDYGLDPDRYIVVRQYAPFTVPDRHALLIGSMTQGSVYAPSSPCKLLIDGLVVWELGVLTSGAIYPGVVARSGQTVEIRPSNSDPAFACGKLYFELR